MGLDDSVIPYVGKLITVLPVYGWGWNGNKEAPFPPAQFDVRLERLWDWRGERRGGVGTIETPDHSLSGKRIVFADRIVGTFNFDNKPGHFNLHIMDRYPRFLDGWPLPNADDAEAIDGFGQVLSRITPQSP